MTDLSSTLWHYAGVLLEEGIDYGDYVEQITCLLFLKMAEERGLALPDGCRWADISSASSASLLDSYSAALHRLGSETGIVGMIYAGVESRFRRPERLARLMAMIDRESWTGASYDVKGHVYESLVERAAAEGKKGMGQFFTPRPLIDAVVRCIRPDPRASKDFALIDPACGTGGFVLRAHEWFRRLPGAALDAALAERVAGTTYYGQDHGERPRRLALMNFHLHGLTENVTGGDTIYDPPGSRRYDVVLTNPPFRNSSSGGVPRRDDFAVATSNKQLNFIQHVMTVLKPGGRAAIVLPDNVLFSNAATPVMKDLLERCDLHTVLRLPVGTFAPYCAGVKANVLFFTKGRATEAVWIYDGRTNVPQVTKKQRPLTRLHFAEFEDCYGSDPDGLSPRAEHGSPLGAAGWAGGGRWRAFTIADVRVRDFKLDGLRWLGPERASVSASGPVALLNNAVGELEQAVAGLNQMIRFLGDLEEDAEFAVTPR